MKGSSKKASGYSKYREMNRAKIRDLRYFLGEGWIDIGNLGNDANISKWKDSATSAYQPKQCLKCKKYWHIQLMRNRLKQIEYLKESNFYRLPSIKETCINCLF